MSPPTTRPGRHIPRFPFAELARVLGVPVIAVIVFVIVFMHRQPVASPGPNGMAMVMLSQKDSAFRPIPPSKGGASGAVWYHVRGSTLPFQLRAHGLTPRIRYVVELSVDDSTYDIGSYTPDARGDLALDTTLTEFATRVCVGRNYHAPKPLIGSHAIKFWVKRDGSPRSGTMPNVPPGTPGASIPCHGNGDGNYAYGLLEDAVAHFTGTASGSATRATGGAP